MTQTQPPPPEPNAAPLHIVDIVRKKRDGHELTAAEIAHIVRAATAQNQPHTPQLATEPQVAAWLLAAFIRGLSLAELHALTTAMRYSGETFDPSSLNKFAVDKHSTGGVGDKTSFLVAPIVAAAGLLDPMISGRALGHTGGTLDKLESIPGFRTQLPLDEMLAVLAQTGAALVGQTPNLVPADRVLYALRDHIGAVESPYLICASIMSKKLAAGLNGLVLDVKTGSGAFLKNRQDALYLAALMVQTGEASGTRTVALLTDMNQPLGRYAGNWLEIQESLDLLGNRRHPLSEDLRDLSLTLAGWMLHLGQKAPTPEAGKALADQLLQTGEPLRIFKQIVALQGGDASLLDNPQQHHQPAATRTLTAPATGYFTAIDTEKAGWAVQRLGAGRTKAGEPVAAHAGIEMHVKLGQPVTEGQPLITLFTEDPQKLAEPEALLHEAITITPQRQPSPPLIYETVTAANATQFLHPDTATKPGTPTNAGAPGLRS